MKHAHSPSSVVVGIDGSDAAIAAVRWAVDESIARDVPLRLIHAAESAAIPSGPGECFGSQRAHAEPMLRAADAAVAATGKTVKVESGVDMAGPRAALITESRAAAMVCVGSLGIRRDRLDHRLDPWRDRYPEVRVHAVPAPGGIAEFVSASPEPVQLAVIGSGQVAPLTRFDPDAAISVADLCSLLVVRQ